MGKKKDNTLRIPPVKELQSASLVNVRHDSISGLLRNSRIYMTYDNDKAYPAYIIKSTHEYLVIFLVSRMYVNIQMYIIIIIM